MVSRLEGFSGLPFLLPDAFSWPETDKERFLRTERVPVEEYDNFSLNDPNPILKYFHGLVEKWTNRPETIPKEEELGIFMDVFYGSLGIARQLNIPLFSELSPWSPQGDKFISPSDERERARSWFNNMLLPQDVYTQIRDNAVSVEERRTLDSFSTRITGTADEFVHAYARQFLPENTKSFLYNVSSLVSPDQRYMFALGGIFNSFFKSRSVAEIRDVRNFLFRFADDGRALFEGYFNESHRKANLAYIRGDMQLLPILQSGANQALAEIDMLSAKIDIAAKLVGFGEAIGTMGIAAYFLKQPGLLATAGIQFASGLLTTTGLRKLMIGSTEKIYTGHREDVKQRNEIQRELLLISDQTGNEAQQLRQQLWDISERMQRRFYPYNTSETTFINEITPYVLTMSGGLVSGLGFGTLLAFAIKGEVDQVFPLLNARITNEFNQQQLRLMVQALKPSFRRDMVEPLLQIPKGLSLNEDGVFVLPNDIDLISGGKLPKGTRFEPGVYNITGLSGSGKTTVLIKILDLLKPELVCSSLLKDKNTSDFLGIEIIKRIREGHVVLPETINDRELNEMESIFRRMIPEIHPAESKLFSLYQDLFPEIREEIKDSELSRFLRLRLSDNSPLSQGQLRRVLLGLACAEDKPVVLIDEPTSLLDPDSQKIVQEFLQQFIIKNQSKIIIFTSNDYLFNTFLKNKLLLPALKGVFNTKDNLMRELGNFPKTVIETFSFLNIERSPLIDFEQHVENLAESVLKMAMEIERGGETMNVFYPEISQLMVRYYEFLPYFASDGYSINKNKLYYVKQDLESAWDSLFYALNKYSLTWNHFFNGSWLDKDITTYAPLLEFSARASYAFSQKFEPNNPNVYQLPQQLQEKIISMFNDNYSEWKSDKRIIYLMYLWECKKYCSLYQSKFNNVSFHDFKKHAVEYFDSNNSLVHQLESLLIKNIFWNRFQYVFYDSTSDFDKLQNIILKLSLDDAEFLKVKEFCFPDNDEDRMLMLSLIYSSPQELSKALGRCFEAVVQKMT